MLNYPLWFGILHGFTDADNAGKNVIYPGASNRKRSLIDTEASRIAVKANFKDHTVLGTFVDNHDHRRFLNINPDIPTFKHAMTFILFTEGIPIIYYGSEQAYNMGGDPESRQAMFADFKQDSDIYKYLTIAIGVRKTNKVHSKPTYFDYLTHLGLGLEEPGHCQCRSVPVWIRQIQ